MVDIWSATVRITPDVLHQELGGETVLLNLANENYFGLDEVGTRVWQVLGETQSASAVLTRLIDEYDVPAEQLRADVAKLITGLADAGLVSFDAEI